MSLDVGYMTLLGFCFRLLGDFDYKILLDIGCMVLLYIACKALFDIYYLAVAGTVSVGIQFV